jgi:hypothetical protein
MRGRKGCSASRIAATFGIGTKFEEAVAKGGLSREQAADLRRKLATRTFELLFVEAMPIQDASISHVFW